MKTISDPQLSNHKQIYTDMTYLYFYDKIHYYTYMRDSERFNRNPFQPLPRLSPSPVEHKNGIVESKEAYYKIIGQALLGLRYLSDEELLSSSIRSQLTEEHLISNPDVLRSASQYLSRWPITTDSSTLAITRYHAEGLPRSISDKKGIVSEFEDRFNQGLNLNRKHTLSTASGTTALWNAYQALGVKPGVKVAVPSYTFHATNSPLIDIGGVPIMMDARSDNGNVTPEIVERTLSEHKDIEVVTVAHMWGIPVEGMNDIAEIVRNHGAYLLEDASHAHGATIDDIPVGSFGDIAVFSCQDNKGIPTGEGGILLTDDVLLHKKLLSKTHYRRKEAPIRGIGIGDEYDDFIEEGTGGIKARMHPLAAVEGISQLEMFPDILAARREYVGYLAEGIADIPWFTMPYIPSGANPSWYGLRVGYKPDMNSQIPTDRYAADLEDRGLDIYIGTSIPVSQQTLFRKNPPNYKYPQVDRPLYQEGDFPGAEAFCKDRLVLPVFSVSDELMYTVAGAYTRIMGERKEKYLSE